MVQGFWRIISMVPPPVPGSIYRVSGPSKIVGLVLIAAGVFFFFANWIAPLLDMNEAKPWQMVFSAVFLLFGLLWTIFAYKSSITFTLDSVEYRDLIKTQQLPLFAIRGRRERVVRSEDGDAHYLKLVTDDDRFRSIEFQKIFAFDDIFYGWFNSLRDLDAADKIKHKDSNFGLV